MDSTLEECPIRSGSLTLAVWDWLGGEMLDSFVEEVQGGDRELGIATEELADWCEDRIRSDVDDAVGMVLLCACRLCNWGRLGLLAEESLAV